MVVPPASNRPWMSGVRPSSAMICDIRARVMPSDSKDRKSTRLNSSHLVISYAVFCLKKKKKEFNSIFDTIYTTTWNILHKTAVMYYSTPIHTGHTLSPGPATNISDGYSQRRVATCHI